MLNENQIEIIDKYVPEKYFDRNRLKKYLELHDMVGVEVFQYVAIRNENGLPDRFETVLPSMFANPDGWKKRDDDDEAYREFVEYQPEDRDTFIRRIPFNFYHKNDDRKYEEGEKEYTLWYACEIENIFCELGNEPFSTQNYHRSTPLGLEDAYQKLEYLFYERGYSLEDIFGYCDKVTDGSFESIYGDWFDYIDKCLQLGWDDVMPDAFYYKYNLARELTGEVPITFYIMEYDPEAWKERREQVKFFRRNGNKLEFYGKFPCDDNGEPVLRWIGVNIDNAVSVECVRKRGLDCYMEVTLAPNTVVRTLVTERDEIGNELEDVDPEWVQIYAGPQIMTFNYKLLKKRRTELGYTQQQVADAVEANIRTYQKWENGETKPDGYYLLRILNWLDIPDVNDIITYDENLRKLKPALQL